METDLNNVYIIERSGDYQKDISSYFCKLVNEYFRIGDELFKEGPFHGCRPLIDDVPCKGFHFCIVGGDGNELFSAAFLKFVEGRKAQDDCRAYLMEIDDCAGVLADTPARSAAWAVTEPEDLMEPCIGKFPVVNELDLWDALLKKVDHVRYENDWFSVSLKAPLGAGLPGFEDRFIFTFKEIEDAMALKLFPRSYNRYDVQRCIKALGDRLETGVLYGVDSGYSRERVFSLLCGEVFEDYFERVRTRFGEYTFIDEDMIMLKCDEHNWCLDAAGMRGLREVPGGLLLGEEDGVRVVVRPEKDVSSVGHEYGNDHFISVRREGGPEMRLSNAFRKDPGILKTVGKVYENACRRHNSLKRFDRLKAAVGLGKGKDGGMKV